MMDAHQLVSVFEICGCLLVVRVPGRPLVLLHLLAGHHQRAEALCNEQIGILKEREDMNCMSSICLLTTSVMQPLISHCCSPC